MASGSAFLALAGPIGWAIAGSSEAIGRGITIPFIRSRGNIVVFIMRMNLIAWARLVILVFKELRIRYGNIALELVRSFIQEIGNILNLSEKNVLNEYFSRMERLDYQLNKQLNEFVDLVNKEHLLLMNELKVINSDNSSIDEKVKSGIKTARYCKVDIELNLYSLFLKYIFQ